MFNVLYHPISPQRYDTSASGVILNPNILREYKALTAGGEYIRVFIFYWNIKCHVLYMLKRKCDINQQNLKKVDLHFYPDDIARL